MIFQLIFGMSLFILSLGFYVGGKEAKKTNKILETGEKTRYEILWYVFSFILAVLGVCFIFGGLT